MSSLGPTPANRYLIVNTTVLDPATLNLILTSIAERLEAQEAKVADYDGAISALTSFGLEAISANLTPVVEQERAAVETLEGRVTLAEDRVAALLASQLPAANIVVTPTGGISATTVQAALAELDAEKADAAALTLEIGEGLSGTGMAVAADFATLAEASAGTVSGKVMSPATTAAAIAALAAGIKLLAATTIASAVASVAMTIPEGYHTYLLVLDGVSSSVAANTGAVQMHLSADGGATWATTSGDYATGSSGSAMAYLVALTLPAANAPSPDGVVAILLSAPLVASRRTLAAVLGGGYVQSGVINNGMTSSVTTVGLRTVAEADTALRLMAGSGSLVSGTISLYGLST